MNRRATRVGEGAHHRLILRLILQLILLLTIIPVGACAPVERPAQPYAGLDGRPIKALAPERVADLLAGRGAGYALVAELNHYPGPRHVLELATALQLSPGQGTAVRASMERMEAAARPLGRRLVELEAALDEAFAAGGITAESLAERTAAIAGVEGQLRAAHLMAHLEMRAILTDEQIERYDRLRGYTPGRSGPAGHVPGGRH